MGHKQQHNQAFLTIHQLFKNSARSWSAMSAVFTVALWATASKPRMIMASKQFVLGLKAKDIDDNDRDGQSYWACQDLTITL